MSLIQPRFASDFPPTLTAHDIGLKDLIESAALLGDLPRVDLITISIGELSSMSMELSEPVKAALPGCGRWSRSVLRPVSDARSEVVRLAGIEPDPLLRRQMLYPTELQAQPCLTLNTPVPSRKPVVRRGAATT